MNEEATFVIRCSRAIFSTEEIANLERYGRELERLANGERAPKTAAQQRFVEAIQGHQEPVTIYERTVDKVRVASEMGSQPGKPGRDGGAPPHARRPRGVEPHAWSCPGGT